MTPCINCSTRHRACHDTCLAYKSFKERKDEINQIRKQFVGTLRQTEQKQKEMIRKLKRGRQH